MGDLRWNSGGCEGGSGEGRTVNSPDFARRHAHPSGHPWHLSDNHMFTQDWGAAKRSSVSWVAKFKGDENEGVLQGVAFMGMQVLRGQRLISLHEKRVRRTRKMK